MLIWYANLPEEIEYMIHRTYTGWGAVGIALGTLKFVIPFFALMHQKMKENEIALLTVGACILIGQWVDLYWLILPAFSPQAVILGWTEIGITLGFLGLFGLTLVRFFSRHPVAAIRDPQFESSVRFHGRATIPPRTARTLRVPPPTTAWPPPSRRLSSSSPAWSWPSWPPSPTRRECSRPRVGATAGSRPERRRRRP